MKSPVRTAIALLGLMLVSSSAFAELRHVQITATGLD
jgi:hypothetical protein